MGLNVGDKRDLLNQVTALGAARTEGGARAPQAGPLFHLPLWPIVLSEVLFWCKRDVTSPFFRAQSCTKLLSIFLPTSFYSLALLCLRYFAHIAVTATFNHIMS